MRLIIISGRSGSGKTIVLKALEDLGFYVVDNLPIAFLPKLGDHIGQHHQNVAVSIDARNLPEKLESVRTIIKDLHHSPNSTEIIYLDADENTLLKRFSETRRRHPLTHAGLTLREAINQEPTLLSPIVALADLVLDTTHMSNQALSAWVRERIVQHTQNNLQVLIQSFGFKYGLPSDADFVFDIRCINNPYWIPALRPFTGLEQPVIDYLSADSICQSLLNDIVEFLEKWIPPIASSQRSYLTIAIGCTGGKHRSVYFSEALAQALSKVLSQVKIQHRELFRYTDGSPVT